MPNHAAIHATAGSYGIEHEKLIEFEGRTSVQRWHSNRPPLDSVSSYHPSREQHNFVLVGSYPGVRIVAFAYSIPSHYSHVPWYPAEGRSP